MPTILLESAIRTTLIAAIIALVLFAMRIKTARVLHAVWSSVVVLMLLLPAWVAWGPRAAIAVLPPDRTPSVVLLPRPSPEGLVETAPHTSPVREDGGSSLREYAVPGIYLFGLCFLLLRLAIGTIRASRLTSASCIVPVTVGPLHSRVILPGCSSEWSEAQLDAVLAHEGEHIRRRDPLFQWLALLNRALFWFHPLAWWLERELSGLAEEACDAAVLSRGHDPRDYSEYLLDVARSVERAGARVNVLGMAMPGTSLPHRIRQILSGVSAPRISRLRMACTVALCTISAAVLAAGTLVHAQIPGPALEVASVKLRVPGQGDGSIRFSVSGNRVTLTNISLSGLITTAYDIKTYQTSGTPNWGNSDRYDVDAKAEAENALTREQGRQLLQKVLADRFQLKLHSEMREMQVYALMPSKGGPKLKKNPTESEPVLIMSMPNRVIQITVTKGTMEQLARQLSNNGVDRPVLDRTGLVGTFDYRLEWSPQNGTAATDTNAASIFTAVQEQLGLKLEPSKAPIQVLVIDSAEKPSEN